MTIFTTVIGLAVLCFWAYRRGIREGSIHGAVAPASDNFGWQVVGWSVALLVPILGLYAMVHLPTICYKQGTARGAGSHKTTVGFSSAPALAGGLVGVVAALFLGLTIWFMATETDDSETAVASTDAPTPSRTPRPTPVRTVAPNFTRSDVLRLAQREVADTEVFPRDTKWVLCDEASYRSGNRIWVVTCGFFYEENDRTPVQENSYTFSDTTGKLQ